MPRIPSALAVVAAFAACIGFNVSRYPEVREMAAASGSALKFSGPKRPAEAKKPASPDPQSSTGLSNKPAAAYCTLDGTCYGPDGQPVSSKPPAKPKPKADRQKAARSAAEAEGPAQPRGPDAVQSGGAPAFGRQPTPPVEMPPAPEGVAGPKKSESRAAEEALVPIVRVGTAPGRSGSRGPRSWPVSGTSGLGRETPGLKKVERLPPPDRTESFSPPATEPATAPDSIPIYPTTAVE
jgi:hypothetical protein